MMTTYTYLKPKTLSEIRNKFVEWLNDHLDDPYEQRTKKTRSKMVYTEDYKSVSIYPVIHMDIGDYTPTYLGGQGYNDVLEEEQQMFMFYYYNQKGQRYTFAEDNLTEIDAIQNRRYLEYLRNKIQTNRDKFKEYCQAIKFGTIPKAVMNNNNTVWVGMLPMMVKTFRRS